MPDFILEIAENERYVSMHRGLVVVREQEKILGELPVDALLSVILSADGITLSKKFLERMAEENIPVIICGANYMPLSIATPVSAHYRPLAVARLQVEASPVLYKQLWKRVVEMKITNQANALELCRGKNEPALVKLRDKARRVKSGDVENQEGQAARLYWNALFGGNFLRNPDEGGINALLNYGYAVLRAACARAICACGLLPLFGIHHSNAYNAFCLADDMMEPLRPLVDVEVFRLAEQGGKLELNPKSKRTLLRVLQSVMLLENEQSSLVPLTQKMAQSLVRSLSEKEMRLELPLLLV